MKSLSVVLDLLRVKQWVKNGFIFMPLVFSGRLRCFQDLVQVSFVFITFCFLSSAVYIFNDIKDRKSDNLHPEKKARPLAKGVIDIKSAAVMMLLLLGMALFMAHMAGGKVFLTALLYLILHVFYTLALKATVILDVIAIALGFELRVWAGAVILGILPSIWLQLCVFLLALFLGFIKRRHEKLSLYERAAEHRGVLVHYTPYFLDQMIMISATLCIITYGLYVLSADVVKKTGQAYMAYTIPFVVYGIFRYLYIVHVKKRGGDPGEILMSDGPFILNLALWISSAVMILYFFK